MRWEIGQRGRDYGNLDFGIFIGKPRLFCFNFDIAPFGWNRFNARAEWENLGSFFGDPDWIRHRNYAVYATIGPVSGCFCFYKEFK